MIDVGMNLEQFASFIHDYAQRLEGLKDTLNELDNRIGDGDHGTNMARGFHTAQQQLQAKSPVDLGAACSVVAMALLGSVGGASGPLYGTIFMKLGGALKNLAQADNKQWIEGLQAAKAGIVERGKAQFGDKTMLDVWEPTLEYVTAHSGDEELLQAVMVARGAALETRDRVARKGRAAYLGPRSAGTCDPGSVSSGLFFEVLFSAWRGGVETIPWETLVL